MPLRPACWRGSWPRSMENRAAFSVGSFADARKSLRRSPPCDGAQSVGRTKHSVSAVHPRWPTRCVDHPTSCWRGSWPRSMENRAAFSVGSFADARKSLRRSPPCDGAQSVGRTKHSVSAVHPRWPTRCVDHPTSCWRGSWPRSMENRAAFSALRRGAIRRADQAQRVHRLGAVDQSKACRMRLDSTREPAAVG